MIDVPYCMSRMRFGQSAADADTLTRARPLATSTESVSCHTEENLGVDQWYKSMSRSPPATAVRCMIEAAAARMVHDPDRTRDRSAVFCAAGN